MKMSVGRSGAAASVASSQVRRAASWSGPRGVDPDQAHLVVVDHVLERAAVAG
jgi:hypothetical protein